MQANKVDILRSFRLQTRQKRRQRQMSELMSSRAAFRYCSHHPNTRRDWLRCLPQQRVELKTIARLRSGYVAIGYYTNFGDILPCPGCGAFDTIRHMLIEYPRYKLERECLLRTVGRYTGPSPSVSLLLGFQTQLPADTLRSITSATAKFVLSIHRHV